MKFILSIFLLFGLSSCQLFDGLTNANVVSSYVVPNSILNPGFDNVNIPQNQITQQPRFVEGGLSNGMQSEVNNEGNSGFVSALVSQAQNLIESSEIKVPETVQETSKTNIALPISNSEHSEINSLTVKTLDINEGLKISGGISITKEGIKVTNETTIISGSESISVAKIIEMVKFVDKIKLICGENYEKCQNEPAKETLKESARPEPRPEPASSLLKHEAKELKPRFKLKSKSSRFLEINGKKKGKDKNGQVDLTTEEIANNSIDLDRKDKEKEVEAAVEQVINDETNLNNKAKNESA